MHNTKVRDRTQVSTKAAVIAYLIELTALVLLAFLQCTAAIRNIGCQLGAIPGC